MADGEIKIAITVDDKQINIATDSLKDLETAGKQAGDGLKETEQGAKHAGRETKKGSGNIKDFAVSLGLVKVASAAFNVLRKSLDSAISRFDTLNTFPKVLQELGVSAEESEKAMSDLSDGIDGLPTKLDDIAATAQRMYSSFSDMDKATDSAIALNNTLLGSGSSADQARRGTEQYLKALQTGKVDMDTWNTLSETMDVGLIKIAEGFGFAGKSAKSDLYNALQSGTVTLDQFNDKMIELGTGTGIMAKLAKENSLGLATSMQNLGTAVARNVANMITKFDELSKNVTGKSIAENIDSLKGVVNSSFDVIGKAIDRSTPYVKGFIAVTKETINVVKALTPVIAGLVAGYLAYQAIQKANAIIEKGNAILKVAMSAQQSLTLITKAQIAAQMASTGATQADIIAKVAQTGAIKLSTLAIGVMTGTITLSAAASAIMTTASYALGAAIQFLLGPIGWVIAGITLLVTAVVAIVKWFKRASAEGKRLNEETESLGESTEALKDSIDGTSDAYKNNQRDIQSNAKASEDLGRKIDELSKKENKSASEKALLSSYVDELNESVEGLNLTYNEEADALNMSSEQLQARIDLMKEQETAQEAQRRLTEILKEQHDVEQQLAETNALREEWNQKLEDGSVKKREYKKAVKELDEQEQLLKDTNVQLAEQYQATEEQMNASMQAVTEMTESGVATQILSFEDLSESQQETVENMKAKWQEYKDSAQDMFDTLSDEVTLTAEEMRKNLEENQRIISEWADNIAELAERGVDQGLLDTLREAGPESAGHVNALVNASDEELERLSSVFAEGGQVATDALSKSLGIHETGVMDAVGDLVTDTEKSLRQQVESADFTGVGNDVASGMADGIEAGTPEAEKASKDMADKTVKATQQALSIHSPSRVFRDIGTDSTDGLTLGINTGTTKVIRASTKMATDMIKPYNRTTASFRSIGINAMNGLNAGLNAGRSRVMATARNIANQVASTMRSALRIHSPSRVMRDTVGLEIPAGIAVGIKDNAKSIFNELDKLTSGIMRFGTPELALGTGRMAVASAIGGGGGASGDVFNRSDTKVTNHIEVVYQSTGDTENDVRRLADKIDAEFAKRKGFNNYFGGEKR